MPDTAELAKPVAHEKCERLTDPILVGPQERIRACAARAGLDISAMKIVNSEHSDDSAAKAVESPPDASKP
jgi:phosphotransacetylase